MQGAATGAIAPLFLLLGALSAAPSWAARVPDGRALPARAGPWGSGWEPSDVAIGDCDGDGNADVVVGYGEMGGAWVAFGDGSGSFRDGVRLGAARRVAAVAIGRRGKGGEAFLALLLPESSFLQIHLGGPAPGASPPGRPLLTGHGPADVAAGCRGEGEEPPFFVVCTRGSKDLSFYWEGAPGRLEEATVPLARNEEEALFPSAVAAGDLDGDGRKDDVAVVVPALGQVALVYGGPAGAFEAAPLRISPGASPSSVAIASFGAKEIPCFVVANMKTPDVTVHLRDEESPTRFRQAIRFRAGERPSALAVLPLEGKRTLLVAVADRRAGEVTAYVAGWEGRREKRGFFPGDRDLRAVALGFLRGPETPFLLFAGRRLHAGRLPAR